MRMNVVQAAIDRYLHKPFMWGTDDCAHLCAFAMRLFGYADPLAKVPAYNSVKSAVKAMKKVGVTNFEKHIDGLGFERIPPAAALPGDIIGIPAETEAGVEWLALGLYVGKNRVMAYAGGLCDLGPVYVCTHAWRVPPVTVEVL